MAGQDHHDLIRSWIDPARVSEVVHQPSLYRHIHLFLLLCRHNPRTLMARRLSYSDRLWTQMCETNARLISNNNPDNGECSPMFDLTVYLSDLVHLDQAGWLNERDAVSGALYSRYCVLADMLLCVFPSEDSDEVAQSCYLMPGARIQILVYMDNIFQFVVETVQPVKQSVRFTCSNQHELDRWVAFLRAATCLDWDFIDQVPPCLLSIPTVQRQSKNKETANGEASDCDSLHSINTAAPNTNNTSTMVSLSQRTARIGSSLARKASTLKDKVFGNGNRWRINRSVSPALRKRSLSSSRSNIGSQNSCKEEGTSKISQVSILPVDARICGYLYHKSFVCWYKVWCVARRGTLYMYRSPSASHAYPELMTPLTGFIITLCSSTSAGDGDDEVGGGVKRRYAFKLGHLYIRSILLAAVDAVDLERWLNALKDEGCQLTSTSESMGSLDWNRSRKFKHHQSSNYTSPTSSSYWTSSVSPCSLTDESIPCNRTSTIIADMPKIPVMDKAIQKSKESLESVEHKSSDSGFSNNELAPNDELGDVGDLENRLILDNKRRVQEGRVYIWQTNTRFWMKYWAVINASELHLYSGKPGESTVFVDLRTYKIQPSTGCNYHHILQNQSISFMRTNSEYEDVFACEYKYEAIGWCQSLEKACNTTRRRNLLLEAINLESTSTNTSRIKYGTGKGGTNRKTWSQELVGLKREQLLQEVLRQKEEIERRRSSRRSLTPLSIQSSLLSTSDMMERSGSSNSSEKICSLPNEKGRRLRNILKLREEKSNIEIQITDIERQILRYNKSDGSCSGDDVSSDGVRRRLFGRKKSSHLMSMSMSADEMRGLEKDVERLSSDLKYIDVQLEWYMEGRGDGYICSKDDDIVDKCDQACIQENVSKLRRRTSKDKGVEQNIDWRVRAAQYEMKQKKEEDRVNNKISRKSLLNIKLSLPIQTNRSMEICVDKKNKYGSSPSRAYSTRVRGSVKPVFNPIN